MDGGARAVQRAFLGGTGHIVLAGEMVKGGRVKIVNAEVEIIFRQVPKKGKKRSH